MLLKRLVTDSIALDFWQIADQGEFADRKVFAS